MRNRGATEDVDQIKISLLQHASLNIEHQGFSITSDPWFVGTAFDGGWDLLFPTPESSWQQCSKSDYVWISHEHPDHFSPKTLDLIRSNSEEIPRIVYQSTNDKKVCNWFLGKGFDFKPLEQNKWINLDLERNVSCMIGKVPFDDSWMALRVNGKIILNTNDCVLDKQTLLSIKRKLGDISVLATQFSYASWHGNENQGDLRKHAAAAVIGRMVDQVNILQPEFLIPFASSVYFCSMDNSYMNDYVNSLQTVCTSFERHNTVVIAMTPGMEWYLNSKWENNEACSNWDRAKLDERQILQHEMIDFSRLNQAGQNYVDRIKKLNNRLFLSVLGKLQFFKEIRFNVSDLDTVLAFSISEGLSVSPGKDYEIEIHSSSLMFLLSNEYGIDTLLVNGRFKLVSCDLRRLIKTFGIGKLNNTGRYIGVSLIFDLRYLSAMIRRLRATGNEVTKAGSRI
jgi:hypothetical protein